MKLNGKQEFVNDKMKKTKILKEFICLGKNSKKKEYLKKKLIARNKKKSLLKKNYKVY